MGIAYTYLSAEFGPHSLEISCTVSLTILYMKMTCVLFLRISVQYCKISPDWSNHVWRWLNRLNQYKNQPDFSPIL